MLSTLLESGTRGPRRRGETVASVVMHLTVIGLAAVATVRPEEPPAPALHEGPPIFILPLAPSTVKGSGSAKGTSRPSEPPVVFVPGPVDVGVSAPSIDAGSVTPSVDGAVGGLPLFGDGIPGTDDLGDALPRAAVDRAVEPLASNRAPEYPAELRRAGIEGSVRVRFIVDTLGRVEPGSLLVVAAEEPRFVEGVRRAVASMRFTAAEARGRKVRMLVELPFVFRLER